MDPNVQDLLNQEAEVVFTEVSNDVILINPNPFLVYEDTVGGKVMKFAPLKKYSLRASLGLMLVERAAENRRNNEAQARSERQHWAQCIGSSSMYKQDMAKRFADEDGTPRTRIFPFPGLVNANSPSGQEFISRGLVFVKETKGEDLEKYLAHYSRFVWDPEADDKKKKGQKLTSTEEAILEAEERTTAILGFKLETPSEDWEPEQKVGFIERHSDKFKVPKSSLADEKWLNEKMVEVHTAFKAKLDKAKVEYTEV